MKKIYNLLCWGALFLLASCGEDGTDVFELGTQDPVVAITGISPDYGYVNDEFDVIGENLAGAVDFVNVYIGENVAKVLSCTDERITVRIPEDATTGKVMVKFFDEELKTDLMLRVLGQPSVESISKEWGFVGDLITFTGTELGTKAEDIKVLFGDAKVNAPVTEWSETSFTVQIPIGATSGKISLMVYTKKVNTPVDEFTIRQHATLVGVTPATAYKGEEVTIKGTSFGTTAEGVKVLMGGVEAEVLSCTEEEIKVRVPINESLQEGSEVAVKVSTPYEEEVVGGLKFTVKTSPMVSGNTGVSPLMGYIGTVVTITGTHMPETAEQLVVKFGGVVATVSDYQYKDEDGGTATWTVKVPNGVSVGNVLLTMAIGELQFYEGEFTVNSSPVMSSIVEKLVLEGESVTVKGTDFGTDKEAVSAFLNETEVEIISISNDEVKIAVPDDFGTAKDAKVSLRYADIPAVEGQTINVMGKSGDVTAVVLKNCQPTFIKTEDALEDNWAIPTDWNFNSNFYYEENNQNVLIRPLIFDKNNSPEGCISMLCNQWANANHKHALENAKMYQVVTLPAGTYKISWTVPECNTLGGNFGVIIGITKGSATLPDLSADNNWLPVDESNFVETKDGGKSYVKVSENKVLRNDGPKSYDMTFVLSEKTEVTIGFVANISMKNGREKGGNVDISKIVIERELNN
ncbi:IPT/TIG domain-containing protein [uncultured Bacteroides sp.]|uniref:IPT/TIG domain-containing protein n=1 Tax=uncultured Bacteroides sp. TaxID=162156 RepID=UPI0025D96E19|nr:IPT/TIG domain-containing protein [uncultured Bacteroides sp.]